MGYGTQGYKHKVEEPGCKEYINKPTDTRDFLETIDSYSCNSKQDGDPIMNDLAIGEQIVRNIEDLPTLPGIAMRILEAVKKEGANLEEIGDILSTDPPLSAKVLKIINSPFYGLPRKITSVPHAVSLLGINTVKSLALSFSLVKGLKRDRGDFAYNRFWQSSLSNAVTCKLIAEMTFPDLPDDTFFLGLLQDIGILALIQCMPKQYSLVLNERDRVVCSFHDAEKQILGFTHAEVGGHLVETWGLPEIFTVPIRYHHHPQDLKTDETEIETYTKILYLASQFVDFLNFPNTSVCLNSLESYANENGFMNGFDFEELANRVQEQTTSIFPIFEIKAGTGKNYTEIIEEARKELIQLSSDFVLRLAEQQKQIESLKDQANRDALTQLQNYQSFHELLEKEIYRSKRYNGPFSIILLDIDHFKSINDRYGHLAGDQVLISIAKCLASSLRKSDTVSRYGGEEFGVILPETDSEPALAVAERLRKAINSLTTQYEDQVICVTISLGIATIAPDSDMSRLDLIKMADKALYNAKAAGRNRWSAFDLRDQKKKVHAV